MHESRQPYLSASFKLIPPETWYNTQSFRQNSAARSDQPNVYEQRCMVMIRCMTSSFTVSPYALRMASPMALDFKDFQLSGIWKYVYYNYMYFLFIAV